MQSLLKVTRINCYNDSGKFKGIYYIGSIFHKNLPPYYAEACQINNDLTMDLMRRIFEYAGKYGFVINYTLPLRSKTMIDEDAYEIVDNEIGNYNTSL